MKLNALDDTIIQILESSIQSGDCSILFDSFNGENSYLEKLDFIFLQIREYISNFCNDLPKTDDLVSNSLQILSELIQNFGISETLCFCLSRHVLLLIIDEKSSINNIKRAIHVLNLLLQSPSIINTIVTDESLEGSLQILGRKIPEIGDYECQALLFEALYRITCNENREYWAAIWFSDTTAKNMFLILDPQKFELNCRKALNYINRNEQERRVFSVIANAVSFGTFQLKEPLDCELWIDFNYSSQSISFYCSEFSVNELEDSALWETIQINNAYVKSYYIKDNEADKTKVVSLFLNCPCHALITSSSITNPAFNSYEVKMSFWGILDVYQHLEKIYGKDKYLREVPLSQNRKVSNSLDVVKIVDELCESYSNGMICRRRVSNSVPIYLDTYENGNAIPETAESQKGARISQSCEIIRIVSESEVCQNSNISKNCAKVNAEILKYSNRKISCSSLNVKVENHYGNQMAEGKRKREKKMTRLCTKKRQSLPVSYNISDNINDHVLKHDTTKDLNEKIESHDSSNHMNIPIRKSSISSAVHIDNLELAPLENKKNSKKTTNGILRRSSDSLCINISEGKKSDHVTEQNNVKEQCFNNEKNSVSSDFQDAASVIACSYTINNKCIEMPIQYKKTNKNICPENTEFCSLLKEKKLERKLDTVKHDIALTSNILQNFHEDIPASSQSVKSSHSSVKVNEEQKYQVAGRKKKLRKRKVLKRSLQKKTIKVSPFAATTSSFSDNAIKENYNPDEIKMLAGTKEQNNVIYNNNKSEKKSSAYKETSVGNCVDTTRNQNVILGEKAEYLDGKNSLHITDLNEFKSAPTEICHKNDVIMHNISEKTSIIEDSLKIISVKTTPENKYPPKNRLKKKLKTCSTLKEDTLKDNKMKDNKFNAENDAAHRKLEKFSNEISDSEVVSKNPVKKIRLYNLESAPVYDVPPVSSSSNPSAENIIIKKTAAEEAHTEISASTVYNSITDEQNNSRDKKSSSRKRSLNDAEKSSQIISEDVKKQMKIYDIILPSDDDFEESFNRYSRKKRRRSATSPSVKKVSTKRKKYEASGSYDSQTICNRRSVPRKAAIQANKRIRDKTPDVACDEIEVMDESDDVSPSYVPEKKLKLSKVFRSDTETGSSEVSWLKQKSCPLFETPPRNYSSSKKNQHKKKTFPEKTTFNKKSPLESSNQQRRKNINQNISVGSSKSKSLGFSDFESFNLTIEKNKKTSYPILEALESDFQSISTSSHKKKNSKNHQPVSKQNAHKSNSNQYNDAQPKNVHKEHEMLEELGEINNDYSNIYIDVQESGFKDNCVDSKDNSVKSKDNSNKSDDPEKISEKESIKKKVQDLNNCMSSSETEPQKNFTTSNILLEELSELDESNLREKGIESEPDFQPESAFTSELTPVVDFQDETKGKQFVLDRFLECAVKCSGSCVDSSKSLGNESESNDLLNIHESYHKSFDSSKNIQNFNDKLHQSRKHVANTSSKSWSRQKKHKRLVTTDHYSLETSLSQDVTSKILEDLKADSLIIVASDEHSSNEKLCNNLGRSLIKNQNCVHDEQHKSENLTAKKKRRKLKNIVDDSFHSKITTISLKENENDMKWFNKITFALSQDANTLTRKLLATVQRCFCEYSAKMSFLRENIIKTAESLEIPTTLNLKPYKIRNLLKSCTIVRTEVEKSLKEMQVVGKEYFEMEAKYYQKLRSKHIKASKKYMSSMQKAEKNAVQKLEGNVILKTKFFFRKFLKYIDSA